MFDLLRGGYYQGMQLVGRLGSGFHRGAANYPQHPDGFYPSVAAFGSGSRFTVENSPGSRLGVCGVILTPPAA